MSFSIGMVLPPYFAISPQNVFEPKICAFIWALFKSINLSCTDVVNDGDGDVDGDDDDIGVYGGDDGDAGGVDAVHSLLKVGRLKEDK